MACRFRPKLSNRFNLRTDCDLDCLPLYATRNCHGNFHPVRDRGVGDAAWLRPIRQGNGKSVASRCAMVDSRAVNYAMAISAGMAERRRVEEELQQQKVVVENANRTKDHFPAMLSHELRTPLTPVISALESLETEPAQTEGRQVRGTGVRSGTRDRAPSLNRRGWLFQAIEQ
jgi:Osmosensitive K+ channel histidine kinase